MHLRISRKTLMDSLNIVSSAVSTTSPLPVLHNIKLTVRDNYLQLTASDSDISIQNKISYTLCFGTGDEYGTYVSSEKYPCK